MNYVTAAHDHDEGFDPDNPMGKPDVPDHVRRRHPHADRLGRR